MDLLLDQKQKELNEHTRKVIDNLLTLTRAIGHEDLSNTVADILERVNAPFTFVIVGEVKAGKSSFVNALLDTGTEVCKVAPTPMTDTIQLITYGPQERIEQINPYYKKIYVPVDILKEIAIVDTPGTNTIVEHHQEITERFIPHSDLIVFVFEAKNPYRKSSWEFFDYINDEWKRKIIFVLQQKDLIEPENLEINTEGVKKMALEKGIENPQVFAVSAKMELEDYKKMSGFIPLRKYIHQNITSGKAGFLKIQNNLNTATTINQKINHSLDIRQKQWEYDKIFRNEIKEILDNQENRTQKQIDVLIENLLANYDRITREKEASLAEGLGLVSVLKRSFGSIFGKRESLKNWLESEVKDFEFKLNTGLREKLNDGILDVADSIQMMGKLVHAKIKSSETILQDSDEIFADIAEKRASVLMDLQKGFSDFMKDNKNFYDESVVTDSGSMAPNLATGSGIAAVGVMLMTIANGAVFDITGGILTTVGVLFAGVSLGIKKRKVLSGFKSEIAKGREKLTFEVSERLNNYTQRIKNKIDGNFFQLDQMLEKEEMTLRELNDLRENINKEIKIVEQELPEHIKRLP